MNEQSRALENLLSGNSDTSYFHGSGKKGVWLFIDQDKETNKINEFISGLTPPLKTNRDLRKALHDAPSYEHTSKLKRAWLDTMCNPRSPECKNSFVRMDSIEATIIPLERNLAITLHENPYTNSGLKVNIYHNDDFVYPAESDEGKQLLDQIKQTHPEQYKLMKWIISEYDGPDQLEYEKGPIPYFLEKKPIETKKTYDYDNDWMMPIFDDEDEFILKIKENKTKEEEPEKIPIFIEPKDPPLPQIGDDPDNDYTITM